jgi:hypothetical protein
MVVAYSDPRVLDAVQRWFKLPSEPSQTMPGVKFIVSPEHDAGVLLEIREGRRFACIDTLPNRGLHTIPQVLQSWSTAPDVAYWLGSVRHPLAYVGDDRILGALAISGMAFLLVNLGMEVAWVALVYTTPVYVQVIWSGPGSQLPEPNTPTSQHGAATPKNATPTSPTPTPTTQHGDRALTTCESAPSQPAPSSSRLGQSPLSSPAASSIPDDSPPPPSAPPPVDGHLRVGQPAAPDTPSPPSARQSEPRKTAAATSGTSTGSETTPEPEYTIVVIPPPRSSQAAAGHARRGEEVRSDPVRAAPRTTPEPAPRSTTGALTPIVLSEEVTAVLVRHLRHAATQLPTAKGADVARDWLVALERACGDMSGIGDVVGGSGVLFSALHAGGHLAVMPSTVSAPAAAKLLALVTPLVEQVSPRRWALRVSALLDPQSAIFRKLARRAPGTCRLSNIAPAAPISTGRVRRAGTENTGKKPATRRNRTTELAVQLAAANAELERLRADVAELRRTVVAPHHGPAVAASTDAAQDPEPSA